MKTVFRVQKRTSFTIQHNEILQKRSDLSFKAKGIHTTLLSFPDDWEFSIQHLETLSSDGKKSLYSGIQELLKAGYLRRSQLQETDGRFGKVVYEVYETPIELTNETLPNENNPGYADIENDSVISVYSEYEQEQSYQKEVKLENSPLCQNGDAAQNIQNFENKLSLLPNTQKGDTVVPLSQNGDAVANNINKNNIYKYNTAADQSSESIFHQSPKQQDVQKIATIKLSQNVVQNPEDGLIADWLTETQKEIVKRALQKLPQEARDSYPQARYPNLRLLIERDLLNPNTFTEAHQQFQKKLNTILKMIRAGRWMPSLVQPFGVKAQTSETQKDSHRLHCSNRAFSPLPPEAIDIRVKFYELLSKRRGYLFHVNGNSLPMDTQKLFKENITCLDTEIKTLQARYHFLVNEDIHSIDLGQDKAQQKNFSVNSGARQ